MIDKRLDDPAEWDAAGTPTKTAGQVIIDEVRVGLPAEIAAQFAGIGLRTYQAWLTEGRAVLRRLSVEPDAELSDKEKRIAQFATDVAAAQAFFVRNANTVLERSMRQRQRVTTKVKTERRTVDGKEVDVEVERTTTTASEPIELGPLMWRLSKLAPAAYGPVTRVELTGADGGAVEIDIGKRLQDVLGRIRSELAVEPEEPRVPNPDQLVLDVEEVGRDQQ